MTWEAWKQKVRITDGYAVLMLTDRFLVDRYPLSDDTERLIESFFEQKLLDMRVFDQSVEYRIFRTDAGGDFRFRVLPDEGEEYFDESQYLDIDEPRSKESFEQGKEVRATGGGSYHLPLEYYQDAKVIVRNYIAYDENSGQAYIRDWRLAGFERGSKYAVESK